MTSEQLRTLGVWALLALLAGGAALLWHALRVRRRRQQRQERWRELCLRLELVPVPEDRRVVAGQLQDADFRLHDTGSDWLLEVPLPQPLLPSGVVLLPTGGRKLRPPFRLRPLRWGPGAPASEALAWYTGRDTPPSKVTAPGAFLEEAERALAAHAPLRAEPRRLVQALRAGALLSVSDVREAVRALDATARRWLDTVKVHGLPRVEALPLPPSALPLLRGVLAGRAPWKWLLAINAGLPFTLGALLHGWQWAFFLLLVGGFLLARRTLARAFPGVQVFAVCVLGLSSTFLAPWYWASSTGRGTSPAVLSVREAPLLPHRRAEFFRFRDGVLRPDLRGTGSALVPVVPKDWQPDEPVTVWATRLPPAHAKFDTLGGLISKPSNVIAAALQHRYSVHPHARFVDFRVHPDAEEARLRGLALLFWGVPNALWLGGVLVLWGRALRGARRAYEEAVRRG